MEKQQIVEKEISTAKSKANDPVNLVCDKKNSPNFKFCHVCRVNFHRGSSVMACFFKDN